MFKKLNMVAPASLESNGRKPLFSSWKDYTIKCGACGSMYPDKVLFLSEHDDARSRCPMCDAINWWSHVEFLEWYAAEWRAEREKQEEILSAWRGVARSQLRSAVIEALREQPRTTRSLGKTLKRFDNDWTRDNLKFQYKHELNNALAELCVKGAITQRRHCLILKRWHAVAESLPSPDLAGDPIWNRKDHLAITEIK